MSRQVQTKQDKLIDYATSILGTDGHTDHQAYRIAQAAVGLSYAAIEESKEEKEGLTTADKNKLFLAVAASFKDNSGLSTLAGLDSKFTTNVGFRLAGSQLYSSLVDGIDEEFKLSKHSEFPDLEKEIQSQLKGISQSKGDRDPTLQTMLFILLATVRSGLPKFKLQIAIDGWIEAFNLLKKSNKFNFSKLTKNNQENLEKIFDQVDKCAAGFIKLNPSVSNPIERESATHQKNKEEINALFNARKEKIDALRKQVSKKSHELKAQDISRTALATLQPVIERTLAEIDSNLDDLHKQAMGAKAVTLLDTSTLQASDSFNDPLEIAKVKIVKTELELEKVEAQIKECIELENEGKKIYDQASQKFSKIRAQISTTPFLYEGSLSRNKKLSELKESAQKIQENVISDLKSTDTLPKAIEAVKANYRQYDASLLVIKKGMEAVENTDKSHTLLIQVKARIVETVKSFGKKISGFFTKKNQLPTSTSNLHMVGSHAIRHTVVPAGLKSREKLPISASTLHTISSHMISPTAAPVGFKNSHEKLKYYSDQETTLKKGKDELKYPRGLAEKFPRKIKKGEDPTSASIQLLVDEKYFLESETSPTPPALTSQASGDEKLALVVKEDESNQAASLWITLLSNRERFLVYINKAEQGVNGKYKLLHLVIANRKLNNDIEKTEYKIHAAYLLKEIIKEVQELTKHILHEAKKYKRAGSLAGSDSIVKLLAKIKILHNFKTNFKDIHRIVQENYKKYIWEISTNFPDLLKALSADMEEFSASPNYRNVEKLRIELEKVSAEKELISKQLTDLAIHDEERAKESLEKMKEENPVLAVELETVLSQQAIGQARSTYIAAETKTSRSDSRSISDTRVEESKLEAVPGQDGSSSDDEHNVEDEVKSSRAIIPGSSPFDSKKEKPAEDSKSEIDEKKDTRPSVQSKLSDQKAYEWLEKYSPKQFAIFKELNAAAQDILSKIPDDKSGVDAKLLLNKKFILDPRGFLLSCITDDFVRLSGRDWRDNPKFKILNREEIVDFAKYSRNNNSIVSASMKAAETMAIDYSDHFQKLDNATILLLSKRILNRKSHTKNAAQRMALEKLLADSEKLRSNETSHTVFDIVKTAMDMMFNLETGLKDSWLRLKDGISKKFGIRETEAEEVKSNRKAQIIACCPIIRADQTGNIQFRPGTSAHQAKDWLDRALKWRFQDSKDGVPTEIMKLFSGMLAGIITGDLDSKIAESDSAFDDKAKQELAKEKVVGNFKTINAGIKETFLQLVDEDKEDKQVIKELAEFLKLEGRFGSHQKEKQWLSVLHTSRLTEPQLEELRQSQGLAKTIESVNRRLALLTIGKISYLGQKRENSKEKSEIKDEKGETHIIEKGFVADAMENVLKPATMPGTSDYGDTSLSKYKFVVKENQVRVVQAAKAAELKEDSPQNPIREEKSIRGLALPKEEKLPSDFIESHQLQVVPSVIPEKELEAHIKRINQQHEDIKELNSELQELHYLVERAQGLVNSQGAGLRDYDLIIVNVSERDLAGKSLAKFANEVFLKNGMQHPVLLNYKNKTYIFGDSSFDPPSGGDEIILLSVDSVPVPSHVNDAKPYERRFPSGVPILAKDKHGKIHLMEERFAKSLVPIAQIDGNDEKLKAFFPTTLSRSHAYTPSTCKTNPLFRKKLLKKCKHEGATLNKWDGSTFKLLSIPNINKIDQERMKDLKSERNIILARSGDKIYLLKYNGQDWVSSGEMKWANPSLIEKGRLMIKFRDENLPEKIEAEYKEISSKFPETAYECFTYQPDAGCTLALMEEIQAKGGNQNYRLTELGKTFQHAGGALFSDTPQLVDGCDINKEIYEEIIKVGGHISPCLDTVDAHILHTIRESSKSEHELECAEEYQDTYENVTGFLQELYDQGKKVTSSLSMVSTFFTP